MNLQDIPVSDLAFPPFDLWNKRWALLAAGDFAARRFNSMTVSWGSMGIMWGKPFVMVVVRPTRYTFGFMEQHDNFTLSVLPPQYKPVLDVLGSKSGRDMDKINASGLTPVASAQVSSPSFAEAELALECRKIYFDDYDPKHFMAEDIHSMYSGDYHRMYFGHIVAARGTVEYRARA